MPACFKRAAHRQAVNLVVVDEQEAQCHGQGSSTSDQYLLSAAVSSTKFVNVTGFSR